jgi:phage baseplate assembly protein W
MKTLAIVDGDLVIGPTGYLAIEGQAKVKQELGAAVREPYGSDRFHPRWGSLLPNHIGSAIGPETEALVRAEVERIVQNYVVTQHEVMRVDSTRNRPPRFATGEAIESILGIRVSQQWDRLHVMVTLAPMSGEQIVLVSSVEA